MARNTLALALFGLLCLTCTAQAGKRSDGEVKVAATAGKLTPEGKQTVEVVLTINNGWHVYANPVDNEDLSQSQTVVVVSAAAKPTSVKLVYPKGDLKKDKIVGDYRIYKKKVTIQAEVQRAPGDVSPLEVSVRIQACDDQRCLLPSTVKVSLK